ncbi:MAG: GntR family transcriptional regulator [Hyphomicrobiaceae bacterium]
MSLSQLDSRPALVDQVHDRLLAAVIDGTLAPGQRVTQDDLAGMLGVSRQPVSHAIQVLRRRGLLVDAGKRGVAVAPIDGARIRDLYQVRSSLDGLAAELAAGRCATGDATRSEIAALRAALDAGGREAATASPASLALLVDADVAFHSALYRLSGNTAIVETVAEQWPHFRRSMRQVLEGTDIVRRVWREHAAILAAVVAGSAAEAGQLARAHAANAATDTVHRLAKTIAPATSE